MTQKASTLPSSEAGVVIAGHLVTSMVASTSGFGPLLYELRKQGAIYDYHAEEEHPVLEMMDEVFRRSEAEFPPDAADQQRRRKQEGKDRASHTDITYDTKRAPDNEVKHTVGNIRRHLLALTRSTAFMLAMSHVCSLQQQIEYSNDIPPNNVADWDRKSWSRQNFFTTPGVPVDPGNFVLGTMFLAMRHTLGMEPPINPDQPSDRNDSGSNRSAQWHSNKCTRHPIVSSSATAGMARKPGHCQLVTNLANANVKPAECLRLVIETLMHDEQAHQISFDTHTHISDDACGRMGDVLEAAGGLIDPWTPAAKPFMVAMHGPHGIDEKNDADAFRSLSGLAQGIKELAGMLPLPKAPDGSKDSNRARIWTIFKELRPDGLALTTTYHKGCWICNEFTRVGGARLLNEDEEGHATHDEPTQIYSVKKYVHFGKGGMLIELGAHL